MHSVLVDDPGRPEFGSWDSYRLFATRVRRDRRFATDPGFQGVHRNCLSDGPRQRYDHQ